MVLVEMEPSYPGVPTEVLLHIHRQSSDQPETLLQLPEQKPAQQIQEYQLTVVLHDRALGQAPATEWAIFSGK